MSFNFNILNHNQRRAANPQFTNHSATSSTFPIEHRPAAVFSGERHIIRLGKLRQKRTCGRSSKLNCRQKKAREWPPAVLKLDVGGNLFYVRRKNLASHPTSRLGKIAYFLNQLSNRQTFLEVLKTRKEIDQTKEIGTKELHNIEQSIQNLKLETSYENEAQLKFQTGQSNNNSRSDSGGLIKASVPGTSSSTNIGTIDGQKPQKQKEEPSNFAFVENMLSFAQDLSSEVEDIDVEKEIASLCDNCNLIAGYFYFDRDPTSFTCISNYYRTNSLHMPAGVCFREFQEELLYWCINPVRT